MITTPQANSALKRKVLLNKTIATVQVSQAQLDALRQKKYENLGNLLKGKVDQKIEILSVNDIELGIGIPYYEVLLQSEKIKSPGNPVNQTTPKPRQNKPKKSRPQNPEPSEIIAPPTLQLTRVPNPFTESQIHSIPKVYEQNDIHPHMIHAPVSAKTFSAVHKLLSPDIKNFWNELKPSYRNVLFAGGSVSAAQASFWLLPGLYQNPALHLNFKNEYLAYWALITGGRLLLNEILSKESSPGYWTIHSLKHIQWEKFSRHFGYSFLSLPLLQSVLYGVLSSTQEISNATIKQSIIFTSMALANGSWLYFTYGLLNESEKVRKHNFFRSLWGSGLGLSVALGLETATQIPTLAKTLPGLIPLAQTLLQNSLILNKVSSDFIAYVIHSRDPVHLMKLKAFAKIYKKILKRYESLDKDLHRQATLDVIRIWIKEAYGKPGLEYFLLVHPDLETLEKNHQLIREMLSMIAPDKTSRSKLKNSLYRVHTQSPITLTPKLQKFIQEYPGILKYHAKTQTLGYFKQKEKPSAVFIQSLMACAKDKAEAQELQRLLSDYLLQSVRKPYAIIENLEPYFDDFDQWLIKMDLKIQRKIKLKKLKQKYVSPLTGVIQRYVPVSVQQKIKNTAPKLLALPLIEYSYHAVQRQIDQLIINHMQLTTYLVAVQNWLPSMTSDKQIDYASLAAAGFSYSTARMLYQSLRGHSTEFLKDFAHWMTGLTALFWVPNSFSIMTMGLILILRPFEIAKKIFNRYYKPVKPV